MSLRRERRTLVAAAAFDAVQLDAVQEHLQLGGANRDTVVRGDGETKGADFETLVNEDVPVLVPVQELDAIAATVLEDEQLSRERIELKLLPHHLGERVERGIFLIPLAAKTARTSPSRPSRSSIRAILSTARPFR
jgi:hypothetical protein